MNPLLPLLSVFLAWPAEAGAQEDSVLPFMEYLDPGHMVTLKWGFSEVQGAITFQLSVRTTGWVGFGFSPNGRMSGSDIVIGGVEPSGAYFSDFHATGNFLPLVDKKQSYNVLSLKEVEGQTTMTFERSIHSCDEDDFHITTSPVKLIYAYGTTDDIKYHATRRGIKEVNLLKYMPKSNLPGDTYLDITMDNTAIPSNHTVYHCRVMQLPRLNVKHHVYRIEPVIQHLDIVHHMLLYRCPAFVTEAYSRPCYMGDVGDACFRAVAAWGVGGGAFELPEDAGIPIGGEHIDTFYRLEIHYNNPTREAGRRDSSGLRLFYTDKLRQHDAGIMTTGLMVSADYNIPPRAAQFHAYGTCNTSLFSELRDEPVPDLHVFSVLLHTHLAGRKVRAGLFRNGEHIDFLGLDENYDFEMQQTINLGNIKTVKPGDDVVVECIYNTANRTGFTKMGFATTDEMCLAFLFYYPAIEMNACWSRPNTDYLEALLEIAGIQVTETASLDQDAINKYEYILKTLPQIQVISDVHSNHTLLRTGTVRNMKKIPAISCRNAPVTTSPATSPVGHARALGTSWFVTLAGSLLLLLWSAVL